MSWCILGFQATQLVRTGLPLISVVHFHVDRDVRISEANNSDLQTQQCYLTKFPFEISEIPLAEWGVSNRRGRGRGLS